MTLMMDVRPDQLRARQMLGVTATYRVIALEPDHALVQVVDVPGLDPGMRFRFDLDMVEAMDVVDVRAEVDAGFASLLADAA